MSTLARAISRVGVRKQKTTLRDITDPLDLLYAVMPEVQERLRDATGQNGGFGAGYEDVPLGFYRDSNLKPTNWRDAVVSMKPGSGTTRLVHKASLDTTPTWKDLGYDAIADLLEEAVQEALSEEEKGGRDSSFELKPSAAINHEVSHKFEKTRPVAEAPSSHQREPRKEALYRVGTRYGGPPPGEHGPWRWGQLEPGSPREKELRAEIASYPRRLSRRLRRYFHGKVVWVTGADRDLGERVAINLTVNGAKVILSGMSLVELERVQRLCILAWMKAVDWEISKAVAKRLTRLDRTLVIPLDVRDDFILPDAARNAEEMLGSPIDMVFHCAGTSVMRGRPRRSESDVAATKRIREVMEGFLWGAVGLTKAVLPSMLDRQQGHIVVITGEGSNFTPQGEQSVEATPRHAALGHFDSLRAEFSRDHVKVTIAHPGITKPVSTPLRDGERRVCPPIEDGLSRTKETDRVVRRLLTGVVRGEHEIFFENRESRGLEPFSREWVMRLARLRSR